MTTVDPEGRIPTFDLQHRMQLSMETAGLTPADMAERLDVSRVTVWGWLHGRKRPRNTALLAWRYVTGCNYDWLLTGHLPPKEPQGGEPVTDNPDYTEQGRRLKSVGATDSPRGGAVTAETHSYRQDLRRRRCISLAQSAA